MTLSEGQTVVIDLVESHPVLSQEGENHPLKMEDKIAVKHSILPPKPNLFVFIVVPADLYSIDYSPPLASAGHLKVRAERAFTEVAKNAQQILIVYATEQMHLLGLKDSGKLKVGKGVRNFVPTKIQLILRIKLTF